VHAVLLFSLSAEAVFFDVLQKWNAYCTQYPDLLCEAKSEQMHGSHLVDRLFLETL